MLIVFRFVSLKMFLKIISSVFLLGLVNGQRDQRREGKWVLFQPRTMTVSLHEESLVTQLLPSSCIVVQPSVPPCRNVRQLDIRPNPTEKIVITASPELLAAPASGSRLGFGPRSIFSSNGHYEIRESRDNDTGSSSWGAFFGRQDVTVTRTAVHFVTAKYHDPNTVITFVVKGCRPSRLPFDLSLCDDNNNATFDTTSGAPANGTGKSISRDVPYLP